MTALATALTLFGMLILLLFFNVPLIAAIGIPTALVMFISGMDVATLSQRMFVTVDAFTLMAAPFFMLAGKLMEVGGMSRRIVRLANCLVGWMQGGLGHVVVVASAFFGALSGSAAATTAAIGSTLIPEMKKEGYPVDFVSGLQAVAGGLGVIIPPSVTMIVYGVASQTSIGKLFLAGILPGILMALLLMLTVRFDSKKRNIAQTGEFTWKELKDSFIDAFPALLVPVIIMGGIYSGLFTPTEAGAIAAVYALIIALFWYKEVNMKNFGEVIGGAVSNTVLVMLIVAASGAFSWLLTSNGVSRLLGATIASIATNKIVFLLLVNLILVVVGCFIESVAAILIVTPIFFPAAMSFGVDPVHFGVIMIVNLALGLCTPPVGENQYIAAAIAGIPLETQVKGAIPFLIAAFVSLLIITFVPQLSLFLPNMLR